jgi:multifunctional 2-oxoglutarate metabolism enzyme
MHNEGGAAIASSVMADNPKFGTNIWVVDEMYREYLADPNSVSESWKEFFSDYEPAGRMPPGGNGGQARVAEKPAEKPAEEPEAKAEQPKTERDGQVPEGATRLRGVASTIARNMQASLDMPTATSIRVVPAWSARPRMCTSAWTYPAIAFTTPIRLPVS